MRAGLPIVILAAAAALSGCGASPASEVQAKVTQFAQATAARDYRTLCEQVLAPSLVRHLTANRIACEGALRIALGGVRAPLLSVGRVSVKGRSASVIALTTASGQQASVEAIELIDTSGGWRVSALGSPLAVQ